MTIERSPLFAPSTRVRFGKTNLILGRNEVGKSAICEWLAGVAGPEPLARWRGRRTDDASLDVRVVYYDPEERRVRLTIKPDGSVQYSSGDAHVPFYPYPLRFVATREYRGGTDEIDDLGLLAKRLGVDDSIIASVLPLANDLGYEVTNFRPEHTEDGTVVRCDCPGTRPGLTIRQLSEGEQVAAVAEIAIALARFSSSYVPTMLILDHMLANLDSSWLGRFAAHLSAPEIPFQTVFSTPHDTVLSRIKWTGWELIELEGHAGGVTVRQELS